MRDKLRKKYQRRVNRIVRVMNKDLVKDPMWRGRIRIQQTDRNWERFSDNSGGELHVLLKVKDSVTKKEVEFVLNYSCFFAYYLWHCVNKFCCDLTRNSFIDKD